MPLDETSYSYVGTGYANPHAVTDNIGRDLHDGGSALRLGAEPSVYGCFREAVVFGGLGDRDSRRNRAPIDEVSPAVRRIMRLRSITTLCLFGLAAVVALKYPLAGLGICICCLIVYLRPDPPGA